MGKLTYNFHNWEIQQVTVLPWLWSEAPEINYAIKLLAANVACLI